MVTKAVAVSESEKVAVPLVSAVAEGVPVAVEEAVAGESNSMRTVPQVVELAVAVVLAVAVAV